MRVAIDVEQPRRVDLGVDLRRRQAGVAEQFLERAQVGAARQQMGREAVAKRVRRQAVGQAEPRPRAAHRAAHEVGIERPALGADEQRHVARQRTRA